MVTGYLSLGSNIEPRYHLTSAVNELTDYFGKLQVSPLYESTAIGFSGEHFINLVVSFNTDIAPQLIEHRLKKIEADHGRVRNAKRFASRTLDIDLIIYGNLVSDEPPILPRADILHYAFILRPLADLAPNSCHPINGKRYADLWANFNHPEQQLWASAWSLQ